MEDGQKQLLGKKRLASVKKHLFKVIFKEDASLTEIILEKVSRSLCEYILKRSKDKANIPKIKHIGGLLIAVEFDKPKRLDYADIDFGRYVIQKLPFKALFNSIEYVQLSLDEFLS